MWPSPRYRPEQLGVVRVAERDRSEPMPAARAGSRRSRSAVAGASRGPSSARTPSRRAISQSLTPAATSRSASCLTSDPCTNVCSHRSRRNQAGLALLSRYVIHARYGRQASLSSASFASSGSSLRLVGGGDRLAEAAEGRWRDVGVAGSAREDEHGSEGADPRQRFEVGDRGVEVERAEEGRVEVAGQRHRGEAADALELRGPHALGTRRARRVRPGQGTRSLRLRRSPSACRARPRAPP